MEISEDSLQSLRCSLCTGYLSHLPIRLLRNDLSVVCGRCDVPDAVPLEMANVVARCILFPCQYKDQGCRERIVSGRMADHETLCSYRPMKCPHLPVGSCPWEGPLKNLQGHFLSEHAFLMIPIQANKIFEADLITTVDDLYLMESLSSLYTVITRSNPEEDFFKCQVQQLHVSARGSISRTKYQLKFFEREDDGVSVTTEELEMSAYGAEGQQDNFALVKISELLTTFKRPAVLKCMILIKKDIKPSSPKSYDVGFEEMLSRLECPICMKYFKAPIKMCQTGHSLCVDCGGNCNNCPTCMAEMSNGRNYHLEQIMNHISFPCKNRDDGCVFVGKIDILYNHEDICNFRMICPMNTVDCQWIGPITSVGEHFKSAHEDNILYNESVTYYIAADVELDQETYLIEQHDTLFKLVFTADRSSYTWYVQSLDSCEERTFIYNIELVDEGAISKIDIQKAVSLPITSSANDHIVLSNVMVASFLKEDALNYKIKIFQK